MPPLTPVSKALQTYELLELILACIEEPRHLRNVRLVNSFWHTIVAKNPLLRKLWQRRKHTTLSLALASARGASASSHSLVRTWCHDFTPTPLYGPPADDYFSQRFKVDEDVWTVNFLGCGNISGEISERLFECEYGRSDAYALVYSVDSRHSFDAAVEWQRALDSFDDPMHAPIRRNGKRRWKPNPRPKPLFLGVIAAHCENETRRIEVPNAEGEELADRLGCPLYIVSADKKQNVDETIEALIVDFGAKCDARRMKRMEERWAVRKAAFTKVDKRSGGADRRKRSWRRWWRLCGQ